MQLVNQNRLILGYRRNYRFDQQVQRITVEAIADLASIFDNAQYMLT